MLNHHKMRPRLALGAAIVTLAIAAGVVTAGPAVSSAASPTSATPTAQGRLYDSMRILWAQHMEWTYDTVVAFAENAGLSATEGRILQNQVDIGNAIVPYYGRAAGTQLTQLLKTHILDAVPVLVAAKDGNKTALNQAVTAWYAQAREVGAFLDHANPYWAKDNMVAMMKTHITETILYAGDILTGNFGQAIAVYNSAYQHMAVSMADMLSRGIIQQFPSKF